MTPAQLKRWHAHRAKGYPPSRFVKNPPNLPLPEMEYSDIVFHGQRTYGMRGTWIEDGFEYEALSVPDECGEIEYLGQFVREGSFPETLLRGCHVLGRRRDTDERFCPAYSILERRDDLHRAGYARGVAYAMAVEGAKADLRRMESNGDDWHCVGVVVRCWPVGIMHDDYVEERGVGEAALWGMESDDETHLRETAMELAYEARRDAQKNIERRCAALGQQHFPFFETG